MPGFGDDWTDWHLTPRGWIRGSRYIGGRRSTSPLTPPDRVLTCRFHDHVTTERVITFVEVVWDEGDQAAKTGLLVTFGPCPELL